MFNIFCWIVSKATSSSYMNTRRCGYKVSSKRLFSIDISESSVTIPKSHGAYQIIMLFLDFWLTFKGISTVSWFNPFQITEFQSGKIANNGPRTSVSYSVLEIHKLCASSGIYFSQHRRPGINNNGHLNVSRKLIFMFQNNSTVVAHQWRLYFLWVCVDS